MDSKLVVSPETIIALFQQGSSGSGCSMHTTSAYCPRKAALDKTYSGVGSGNTFKMDVGTVFHYLADLYHTQKYALDEIMSVIPWSDVAGYDEVMEEAKRIFSAYTERYAPDFWGDVLGTEWALHEHSDDVRQAIDEALVPGFTLRIDMVVRITESDRVRIRDTVGLDLLPGVYLCDYKTRSSRPRNGVESAQLRLQFNAYQMAWNASAPFLGEPPCQGMLVINVVRLKKLNSSCFPVYLVDPTPEYLQDAISSALQHSRIILDTEIPLGVITGCESFGSICEYHPTRSGLCTLI